MKMKQKKHIPTTRDALEHAEWAMANIDAWSAYFYQDFKRLNDRVEWLAEELLELEDKMVIDKAWIRKNKIRQKIK